MGGQRVPGSAFLRHFLGANWAFPTSVVSDLTVFTTGTIDRVDCLRPTTRHEVHIGLHSRFDSDTSLSLRLWVSTYLFGKMRLTSFLARTLVYGKSSRLR